MEKCPLTNAPCPHKKCIHSTEITNYQATSTQDMCISCGLPYMVKEGNLKLSIMEIMDAFSKMAASFLDEPPVLPTCTCGHTLEEIMITGKLGCGNCYEFFRKELLPLIEKCQNEATKHVGKTPKNHPKILEKLEQELKAAIAKEDYVEAAKLRDEIKKLK